MTKKYIDTSDLIVKALIEELYSYGLTSVVSNNYAELVQFMEAYEQISTSESIDSKLLAVVPSDVYHPEVRIAIDFTHQFVQTTEKIEGKRVVSKKVLERFTERIFVFVNRYFNYIGSFGDRYDFIPLVTEEFEASDRSERDINIFLNRIINYFMTSVSINRARKQIGSATIIFKDVKNPRARGRGNYRIFFDGAFRIFDQLLAPMLPVTIWGKGRLYKNWYFPIFDGYIVATSPTDSNGFVEYEIMCKDALELARISVEMINPSIIQVAEDKKVNAINLLSKPFYGHSHFNIMRAMILGGKLKYDPQGKEKEIIEGFDLVAERKQTIQEDPPILTQYDPEHAPQSDEALPLSALGRFTDAAVDKDTNLMLDSLKNIGVHKERFTTDYQVDYVSHRERNRSFVAWGDRITPYRIWTLQSPDTFSSTFSTRLDVMTEVADLVYYDFYIDGCGNFHYHPMRLVNEFLWNDAVYYKEGSPGNKQYNRRAFPHAQVIMPEEVFSTNTLLNIEQLVTFLRVTGQAEVIQTKAEILELYGSARDKDLSARYGYRRQEINNTLFNVNPTIAGTINFLDVAAMVMMRFANAELYTRQQTIVFRPELDIGSPVFFTEDNNVFYINSIDHNIVIGGDATTSINCSFGRKDIELPPDLTSFVLATEVVYNLDEFDPGTFWRKLKVKNWYNYLDVTPVNLEEIGYLEAVPEVMDMPDGLDIGVYYPSKN